MAAWSPISAKATSACSSARLFRVSPAALCGISGALVRVASGSSLRSDLLGAQISSSRHSCAERTIPISRSFDGSRSYHSTRLVARAAAAMSPLSGTLAGRSFANVANLLAKQPAAVTLVVSLIVAVAVVIAVGASMASNGGDGTITSAQSGGRCSSSGECSTNGGLTHGREDLLPFGTPAAKTIVIPAKPGRHAATVVWLHGLGDTGYGWSDLCETVDLPHIKWILPSAPIVPVSINGGMPCPSWFDLFGLDASTRDDVKGIDAAARYVAGILEEEKKANPDIKFAVGGFSQGGALSLYLMSRKVLGRFEDGSDASAVPLTASVAFSGWLPRCSLKPGGSAAGVDASAAEKAAAHPLLMCHGEADSLVLFSFGKGSAKVLQEAGFSNLTFKSYPGMAHSACPQELSDLKAWLQKHLSPPS